MRESDKFDIKVVLLLFLVAVIVYLPSISAPFIIDDNHMIVENMFIKHLKYIPMFFKGYVTSFPIPRGMCRPLLMLTFMFNYANGKLNPIGYHIINILFHFLNATLLYLLLLKLQKNNVSRFAAASTALLFVVHPLNTEAITYISSRSDLMVTSLLLAGVIFLIKIRLWTSLLCYTFALLTKETGLTFPILVGAYTFIHIEPKRWFEKKRNVFYLSIILITVLYIIYKSTIFSPTPTRFYRSVYSNVLVQSVVTLMYLKLFVFPHPLNILHYVPNYNSILTPEVFLSVTVIAIMFITIFLTRKKSPLIATGISWFLIGVLPKFYARLHYTACEHHFYLPGIGLFIIVFVIINKYCTLHKRITVATLAGVTIIMAITAMGRNHEYSDPLRFWEISAQRNPHSGLIHNNLGVEYMRRRLYRKAEEEMHRAIALADDLESIVNGRINLAYTYIKTGKYKEAEKEIKECLKVSKTPPLGAHQTLGVIYTKMGRKQDALEAWSKEIKLFPAFPGTYLNIGIVYLNEGKLDKALRFFRRAIEVNPNHYGGYYWAGEVFERKNMIQAAIEMYRKAARFAPDNFSVHYSLGSLYAKTGDNRALYELKTAIRLNPGFAPAHNDLAVLYASMVPPRWKEAKEEAEKARALGYKVDENFLKMIHEHIKNGE